MMPFSYALFTSSEAVLDMFRLKDLREQLQIVLLIAFSVVGLCLPKATGATSHVGENIFRAKCAVCHGIDGAGETANGKKLRVPDLRSNRVQELSDDELLDVVTNGKREMPSFGKKYRSDQLQQVVTYIRSLGSMN
jgi:mono/diheme cytochrome c family protein